LGDFPYTDNGASADPDEYPLMSPFDYTEYDISLVLGWNLVSLPTRQFDYSVEAALDTISGYWDYILTYDPLSSEHWLSNSTFRPDSLNDQMSINHRPGYWIRITNVGVTLTVKGDAFGAPISMPLYAGWNLVGYPSLTEKAISEALAGTGYVAVEGFNALAPYNIDPLADTHMMKPGEGYWVEVPVDTTWTIDW
jgi:hypothetical protein